MAGVMDDFFLEALGVAFVVAVEIKLLLPVRLITESDGFTTLRAHKDVVHPLGVL